MDCSTNFLNFTESEYDDWLEQFSRWAGTAEHVLHTMPLKALTDSTQNFLLLSNLRSNEEPTASNICLEYLCGYLYPFIKPISVRDKQSDSCLSIYYKPPLFSREDKENENLTSGKNRENSEPNKYWYPNSPNMEVLIEHAISGHKFLLLL